MGLTKLETLATLSTSVVAMAGLRLGLPSATGKGDGEFGRGSRILFPSNLESCREKGRRRPPVELSEVSPGRLRLASSRISMLVGP